MEIQEFSLPAFYCSRILGLAPYLIRRNNKNRIDEIRRSPWLCLYSICIMTATVSLTVRFIFIDANSRTPIRKRTATSRFVTAFDVSVVMGACLCGAVTGIVAQKIIQQINFNLNRVDDVLSLFNKQSKDKKRNIILVVSIFLFMTGMLILDAIAKIRNANIYKDSQEQPTDYIQIKSSLPFYVLYYILIALHAQLAQCALGIQRRYLRLNSAIRDIFSLGKMIGSTNQFKINKNGIQNTNDLAKIGINDGTHSTAETNVNKSPVAQQNNHDTSIFDPNKYMTSVSTTAFGKLASTTTKLTRASFVLDHLSCTHALLGETVTIISMSFGILILVMLASCLLHLVATIYFLFIGLLGDPDWFVASLQLIWCIFHMSRLLLIVEPCHMARAEANKTVIIVCEAIRNCQDSATEAHLTRFWHQLVADRTFYFTACGLCTIDRKILTSISGAITTYLVILIQFQRSDA